MFNGKKIALSVIFASTLSLPLQAQDQPSGDPEILPPGAQLEVLFDGAFFSEGAAVALDGSVFFSDITFTFASNMQAGRIWRYDPQSGTAAVFRSPSGMSNGLKFDARGHLIAAEGADYGGRRLTRTNLETGQAETIAGLYQGKPFNSPNDITIDEKGRIYFSDPRYLGHEPVYQPVFGVYRIDTDGSIERIITDAGKPNGVALSPDNKSLYVVSNDNGALALPGERLPAEAQTHKGRMALLAYDLNEAGQASFREVLVDYPQDGPDGLVVDAEGNLYVAVRDVTRPGIYVYSPKGEERAYIPTPELPTNAAFGRDSTSKTLYITYGNAAAGGKGTLASIKVNKAGYRLPSPE
jgi:gluconolactonase